MSNLTFQPAEINVPAIGKDTQVIGRLLLDSGKISPTDAERILRVQREQGLRFGDAAKILGLVTEEDIQEALALQFDFPFIPNGSDELSSELIAAYHPFTEQAELLRAVRSQLLLRWFDGDHKALAIVSTGFGEGRSYLAANLAIVFSQLGERTLLMDADLRHPRQHQLFRLDQTQGLSDLLAGRVDASVIARIPPFRSLSVIPSGTIPPNPQELFARGMAGCLRQFFPQYDVILIDTPASLHGGDAQLLASKVGGALLLARKHVTRLIDLENLKHQLEAAAVTCVGAVIADF